MFPYAAMIIGLIVMCVPEDASLPRIAIQGFIGLGIFLIGVASALSQKEA